VRYGQEVPRHDLRKIDWRRRVVTASRRPNIKATTYNAQSRPMQGNGKREHGRRRRGPHDVRNNITRTPVNAAPPAQPRQREEQPGQPDAKSARRFSAGDGVNPMATSGARLTTPSCQVQTTPTRSSRPVGGPQPRLMRIEITPRWVKSIERIISNSWRPPTRNAAQRRFGDEGPWNTRAHCGSCACAGTLELDVYKAAGGPDRRDPGTVLYHVGSSSRGLLAPATGPHRRTAVPGEAVPVHTNVVAVQRPERGRIGAVRPPRGVRGRNYAKQAMGAIKSSAGSVRDLSPGTWPELGTGACRDLERASGNRGLTRDTGPRRHRRPARLPNATPKPAAQRGSRPSPAPAPPRINVTTGSRISRTITIACRTRVT